MKTNQENKRVVCFIDFPGFYESNLSYAIDQEQEQWTEYYSEGGEESQDDFDLSGLNAGQVCEAMFFSCDYRKVYQEVAKHFAAGASSLAAEFPGLSDDPLQFESMDSPREYNFSTDRLFLTMSDSDIAALFAISKADGHAGLGAMVEARFTSYDGFASFYSADLADWIDKPLAEWDHNELGTLLSAILADEHGECLQDELHERTFSGNGEESDSLWSGIDEGRFRAELDKQRAGQ